MQLSEQEIIRRENLEKLKEAGVNPYPGDEYLISHSATKIKSGFNEETKEHIKR